MTRDTPPTPTLPCDAAVPPGWVRVDFHMHTYGSGDAVTTVDEFGAAVEAARLDVVCVTDHNAIHVAQALQQYLDVRVVVGEEVKTHEGELIGLFLTERVTFGLPAAECARRVHEQGGATYVPHPIGPRSHAMGEVALTRLAEAGLVDAVEVFNARNPLEAPDHAAAAVAARHGLPGGAGSDAHYPDEIGAACLLMPDFDGPLDMVDKMHEGRVYGRRHDMRRSSWRPRIIPASSHEGVR